MKKSMVNRTIGVSFEEEMCDYLSRKGWWSMQIRQTEIGQPADIIAAKCNVAMLIDCKVCTNNKFSFSRVEGNQETAMKTWMDKGNSYVYFALKLNDGEVYFLSFLRYCMFASLAEKTGLSEEEIRKLPKRKDIFPEIEKVM